MSTKKYIEVDDGNTISIDKLLIGAPIPFDVFVKDKDGTKPLFNKGTVFTGYAKDILRERGVDTVYIKAEDNSTLDQYLSKSKRKEILLQDDIRVFKDYSFYKEQYHQIDRTFLIPGMKINFSLFLLNKFKFEALVEAAEKSSAKIGENLLSSDGDILIKKTDIPLYQNYLNSLLKEENISEKDKSRLRVMAVKEKMKIVIKDILDEPRRTENIKASKAVINEMVGCILENRDVIYDLLSLRTYDYYTYIHSVNVAVLSVGLGIAISMEKEDVEKLGLGTMLHDIGKSAISSEIINKQGKLDNSEYQIFKAHVMEGERILREHKDIPEESFYAVLQHHEKLTGKGYPYGLSGENIKLFGRIAAIADCYDALTTPRPFKYALTPFLALLHIGKEKGNYDPELLKTFVKMLGNIK